MSYINFTELRLRSDDAFYFVRCSIPGCTIFCNIQFKRISKSIKSLLAALFCYPVLHCHIFLGDDGKVLLQIR